MYEWLRNNLRDGKKTAGNPTKNQKNIYHSWLPPDYALQPEWTRFLVTRNPYERTMSWWQYGRSKDIRGGRKPKEFMPWILSRIEHREEKLPTLREANGGYSWLVMQGELVDWCKATDILKLERIEDELGFLFSFYRKGDLPHRRKSPVKVAESFFEVAKREWIEAVNIFCASDFDHPVIGKMYDKL